MSLREYWEFGSLVRVDVEHLFIGNCKMRRGESTKSGEFVEGEIVFGEMRLAENLGF